MLSYGMAKTTNEPAPADQLAELKAKYGRLVVVEVDGEVHAFRPLDRAKLAHLQSQLRKCKEEQQLEVLTNQLEFVCVTDRAAFRTMADAAPLCVDGIYGALTEIARGNAEIKVL